MADNLSPEHRSWNMSRIRCKDTAPEKLVRSFLHSQGFRFRLHMKALPGRPDVVLRKWNAAILVHGCYWHRHRGCKNATTPKSHVQFWNAKFEGNKARDRRNEKKLEELGWDVVVIWECQTRDPRQLREALTSLLRKRRNMLRTLRK